MLWLLSGIGLFTILHLSSAAVPSLRDGMQRRHSGQLYRGLYSVVAIASILFIVLGWRSTVPVAIYAPPTWGPYLAFLLMFVAILLFGASHAKTNATRFVRHPQLAAVVLWACAHLLSNGDKRSLILFASLGIWALIEMPLINRREGGWQKPLRASMRKEWIGIAITVVVYLVLIALHRFYAGVSPLP